MFAVFMFAANAVLPIVLIIALGYVLRRTGFLPDSFFGHANRLMFRVALPAMLFYNIYSIESLSDIKWGTVIYAVAATMFLVLLGLVYAVLFVPDRRQKGVVMQAAFRSNSAIIGYQLASALGGETGLQVVSLVSAFTIAIFNVMSVVALSLFTGTGKRDRKSVCKNIIKNPLIIAIGAGLGALVIRWLLPSGADGEKIFSVERDIPFVYTALGQVASIASPIAFLVLGGRFSFSAVKGMFRQIAAGTILRLVVAPLLTLSAAVYLSAKCALFDFGAPEYACFVALFGSPVAVASAVMAKEMDNDELLAGQLVVWSSVVSIFTLFVTVVILRSLQLL